MSLLNLRTPRSHSIRLTYLNRSPSTQHLRLSQFKAKPHKYRYFTLSNTIQNEKTFDAQNTLPKLPVPPLSQTLSKYLVTLRPQLMQEAADKGIPESDQESYVQNELKKRQDWANDFQHGLGSILQDRLIDVDHASPNNWLDDNWWLEMAYHTWRVPLFINSNWWVLIKDDEGIPADVRNSVPKKGTSTPWQIKRAALLVRRAAEYNLHLNNQDIPVDRTRYGAFCMHQLKLMFSQTRIPGLPRDRLKSVPFPNPYRTVLVYANEHPYIIDAIEANGDLASLKDIEARLWAAARDAERRGPSQVPVSLLTADDRDSWTNARERLLNLDHDKNRESLNAIEDALFGISLDFYTVKVNDGKTNSSVKGSSPDIASHLVAAKSAGGEGRNRWWDKALTFSVESNGRASLLGEHSPCDALIPSFLAEYVAGKGLSDPQVQALGGHEPTDHALDNAIGTFSLETLGVKPLHFVTDETTLTDIEHALETTRALAKDSDTQQLWYDEYGTDFIKKVAGQAPDAFCQMALQIAYYLTHGRSVSTYETASTRAFRHGRTDVIRSFSEPALILSRAVAELLQNNNSISSITPQQASTIHDLLTKATKAHSLYTREASFGKGIDRHLLGLRLTARAQESHPLIEDHLFAQSQNWILSTSGLSAAPLFNGTGFGAPKDGYGINYLAGPNYVKFGIDSKRSSDKSDIDSFKANIVRAMRLLQQVAITHDQAQAQA